MKPVEIAQALAESVFDSDAPHEVGLDMNPAVARGVLHGEDAELHVIQYMETDIIATLTDARGQFMSCPVVAVDGNVDTVQVLGGVMRRQTSRVAMGTHQKMMDRTQPDGGVGKLRVAGE